MLRVQVQYGCRDLIDSHAARNRVAQAEIRGQRVLNMIQAIESAILMEGLRKVLTLTEFGVRRRGRFWSTGKEKTATSRLIQRTMFKEDADIAALSCDKTIEFIVGKKDFQALLVGSGSEATMLTEYQEF